MHGGVISHRTPSPTNSNLEPNPCYYSPIYTHPQPPTQHAAIPMSHAPAGTRYRWLWGGAIFLKLDFRWALPNLEPAGGGLQRARSHGMGGGGGRGGSPAPQPASSHAKRWLDSGRKYTLLTPFETNCSNNCSVVIFCCHSSMTEDIWQAKAKKVLLLLFMHHL
jgi:hypothetical protein